VTRPKRLRASTFCSDGGPVGAKYRTTVAIVVANAEIPAPAVALLTPVPTEIPLLGTEYMGMMYAYKSQSR
jgi:hypothetical protein